MACAMCEKCDCLIDLDYNCEAYREELDMQLICDGCMDAMANSGELIDTLRTVQNGKPFTKEQQEMIDQTMKDGENVEY